MNEIKSANINDIPHIIEIAHNTWFDTYKNIISQEQIDYMYGEMYSPDAILKQMEFLKHEFILISYDEKYVGFASFSELMDQPLKTFKLHKLYLLPTVQNKGLGRKLINEVEKICKSNHVEVLQLNVNRNNPAYHFYLKNGYTVKETVDIPLAEFWLNDYIMEKKLFFDK